MTLKIPDGVLEKAGLTEREALIEFACRLFDAGKLDLWPAAQLANLSRAEFEAECHSRQIPVYRPTIDEVRKDAEHLRKLGA